jgi:hypothetical protein
MMKNPKLLVRIAAGLVLFFALGHSMGHFSRHDMTNAEARDVQQLMIDTRFELFGHTTTFDGQYNGMSLNLIFTLLAFAIILWIISNNCMASKRFAARLLLPMAVCVLLFSVTSFMYFFPVPGITCLLASVFMVLAIVALGREA